MALLAYASAEAGNLGEFFTTINSVAASQVQAHNGTWAVRANPGATTGTVSLRPPSGDMGRTATTIYVIWYRYVSTGVTQKIASVQSSAAAEVAAISITTGRVVTGVGATTSATVATVPANTWFACILTVVSNGASSLAIDGLGVAQSFTANNVTQDRIVLGIPSVDTADLYMDDIAIYDANWTAGTSEWAFGRIPGSALSGAVPVVFGRERGWSTGWGRGV